MRSHPYLQLLGVPWRTRDREAPWGRRLIAVLVLGLGLAGVVFVPREALPMLLAAMTSLAAIGAWMMLVSSLLTQNHPHAARLVPGHLRRLRSTALLVGAAIALGGALLWRAVLPVAVSLPLLLLIGAGVLGACALMLRHWLLAFFVAFGPGLFFGAGLDKRLAPLALALRELWLAQPWTSLAPCLLVLGLWVAHLFGDGNAAHQRSHATRQRLLTAMREGATGKRWGAEVFGEGGAWLNRPIERANAAWLAHTLRRAAATPRSIMQRAEIVLHGPQHWLRQLMGTLLALALLGLGAAVAWALAGHEIDDHWRAGAFGMAIGLSSMGFNPSFALPQMLWHTRREQALLKLLPGMPQGQAQSRAVALLQLRHAGVAWMVTTVGLVLLACAADDHGLLCLAFAALPLGAGCLLRAPATMRAPRNATALWPVLVFIVGGWGLVGLNGLGVPLPALALSCLLLALAVGLWRWHALRRAPTPLPAGRLA